MLKRYVIPRRHNSLKGNANLNRGLYRYRHLVENIFARLKHYRAFDPGIRVAWVMTGALTRLPCRSTMPRTGTSL